MSITTAVPPGPSPAGTDGSSPRTSRDGRARTALAVVAVLVVAVLGLLGARALRAGDDDPGRPVPQSAEMETALGVRISRVAVVGDGGLVTLSYVVLDVDKASRFQADTKHPPVLRSEARDGSTQPGLDHAPGAHQPRGRDVLLRLPEHRRRAPRR